jgi:glucosamine-6-phosphate deaminase
MEVIIQPDARSGCSLAARMMARLVRANPRCVLGLAAGNTPLLVYGELIRLHQAGLSFRSVTTFNLDEYVGLPETHPASFHRFMHRHLFAGVDIEASNIFIPNGMAQDLSEACRQYEHDIVSKGGIDLQLLGIGTDGHIGFNEPSSSLGSRTRIKTLTPGTRRDNAAAFGGEIDAVPKHVLTMGVGTIMEARTCLLLAFGPSKAAAVAKAVEGPVTAMVPASALQFHRDARVILDPPAASLLTQADYYKWVYEEKPHWQRD